MNDRLNIAVIGGGVAGITAAHLLQRAHTVTLFEQDSRLGGHTNTVQVQRGPDAGLAIDTGFIVMNDKTYPLLHALLRDLGIAVRWSDMSFSYYDKRSKFSYAGTTLNGLFADRSNLFKPGFYRFLWELGRFCRDAETALQRGEIRDGSLREFLGRGRYSQTTIEQYILPMGGAIWSAPKDEILDFPAQTFIQFFHNHGLLSFKNRPRWQTVCGGSSAYVRRFAERFTGTVRVSSPVQEIRRSSLDGSTGSSGSITVCVQGREPEHFDRVVIAAHADQALSLLADPTSDEQRLLGAWRYQLNHTVLHNDVRVLAPRKRAWASWNYVREEDTSGNSPVSVTYHMNRLQGLQTKQEYLVSLNMPTPVPEDAVVYETYYTHPVYTATAVRTQEALGTLNGTRDTYFCGSYFGYGFHEDAVAAAVKVAQMFGQTL